MKEKTKRWLRPVLFTAGGALAGFGYYYFIGCATGSCPITANPISSMIYDLHGRARLAAVRCVWEGM